MYCPFACPAKLSAILFSPDYYFWETIGVYIFKKRSPKNRFPALAIIIIIRIRGEIPKLVKLLTENLTILRRRAPKVLAALVKGASIAHVPDHSSPSKLLWQLMFSTLDDLSTIFFKDSPLLLHPLRKIEAIHTAT
jgi:hypothetical protein